MVRNGQKETVQSESETSLLHVDLDLGYKVRFFMLISWGQTSRTFHCNVYVDQVSLSHFPLTMSNLTLYPYLVSTLLDCAVSKSRSSSKFLQTEIQCRRFGSPQQ